MPLKKSSLLFLFIFFLTSISALPTLKRDLIVKGSVLNHEQIPIQNATILVYYSSQSYAKIFPQPDTLRTDSSGQYKIKLKSFGTYKAIFSANEKIPYTLTCFFTKNQAEQLRKLETVHTFDVILNNQTRHVKNDIYNGASLNIRSQEIVITPLKKYLQAHDYKYRKGFKKQQRALKYIVKKTRKQQLEKLMRIVANRNEIDTVIQDTKYDSESRMKWRTYFGKTNVDTDKIRMESFQDFYHKVTQTDSNGVMIYTFKNYTLDLTKTVMADDTKKVFSLYRFNFNHAKNETLTYDVMLFHTLTGWKVHYISENY